VAGKWSLYDLLMTGVWDLNARNLNVTDLATHKFQDVNLVNVVQHQHWGEYLVSRMMEVGSVLQGLWRVDDHDISRLAAVTRSPQKQTSASTAEEGRGPHVALSVRLKRKDPDRQFHIGERIPYVLMANSSKLQVFSILLSTNSTMHVCRGIGWWTVYSDPNLHTYSRLSSTRYRNRLSRLLGWQDDMAEDPVDAMTGGSLVNTHIYLENKLRKPLESVSGPGHNVWNCAVDA
jgi:hypothetical protein